MYAVILDLGASSFILNVLCQLMQCSPVTTFFFYKWRVYREYYVLDLIIDYSLKNEIYYVKETIQ